MRPILLRRDASSFGGWVVPGCLETDTSSGGLECELGPNIDKAGGMLVGRQGVTAASPIF